MRIITLVGVMLCATVAMADEAESRKLFDEGIASQNAGKLAEACAKFQKSYDVDVKEGRPAPGTQLQLGECAERGGELRKAYVLYESADQEYKRRAKAAEATLAKDPNSAEGKTNLERANVGKRVSREHADALAPKLAKVIVRIVDPGIAGLAVRIGDRAVSPAAEVVEHLDAGTVTVTASAPGREPFTTSAKAESGKQVVVEIPALRVIGGRGGPDKPDKPKPVTGARNKTRVRIAYGLGGAGIVLVGITSVVGLQANSKYDKHIKNCPDGPDGDPVCADPADLKALKDAGNKADLATVFGIGGVALVAGAAVVFFTAPREGVTITPTASPTGGGVTVRGRF